MRLNESFQFQAQIQIDDNVTAPTKSISAYCPDSPVTPHLPPIHAQRNVSKYSIATALKKAGYKPVEELCHSLQGSIWRASRKSKKGIKKKYVIKVTQKSLHEKSVTRLNGKEIRISENIIKETAILRYLTCNKAPCSITKFEDFFCDKNNFFLVMEDGGNDFFEFVARCHRFIENGSLEIAEWHRFCKIAFKQMTDLLEWMHNTMNCCHLDISLENFVINDVMVILDEKTKKMYFQNSFQIKLCDFGLAEVFTAKTDGDDIDFGCKKYVGKTAYKSPKVYGRCKVFDARCADVWSLGICFFMMIIGGSPFKKPAKSDPSFEFIMKGKLIQLLDGWDRIHYVTPRILDLMVRLFRKEKYRLTIKDIQRHPWLL